MKEFALQYNIPLPPTTIIGIFHRRTFPLFQSTRNRGVNYSSTAAGSRIKSNKPLQVEEFEDGLCSSRYYVRSKDEEEEVEEDEETSSSMLLSLSMKPDRNMSLLDDYEMEEMNYVSDDPNHRSGYVAVVGKPNVGKSTLSNQMIGQKLSIVTDKPQTTRHRILGICSGSDYQMILYDTPGVIEKRMHKLDSMMMKNVRSAAINADCVVIVVDACRAPEKIDEVLEQGVGDRTNKLPTLLVLNKKDLIKPGEIAKKIKWYEKFTDVDEVIPVSAKFGHGVDDVKEWILSKLPRGPAYYPKDISSEHPERFFVGEIVREKIFMQYRNEVPYACQVNVISYKSRPNAKDFIQVEIVVEKNSQKIILIGKEGKALKVLATAARLDIEDFLQKNVFLEIEVKVKENWRQNEGLLKYYGYGGQIQAL
ncbi:GTPase ERA-like, chloroplastic isoform X3 [Salvia miltiorrhiza]|uniref:GTPase ERA-like, chloroplastic isoform X3 n=1 Tax=Salvia miltiorrhiza TaxID=226208 RepID=UPI0025ABEB9C|nr:GTPase ERA-like, chloroplastic isoform X3 [Salvia miltiorrhiza]XP_057786744.1 GTPase ERA-like, chloroplastic isoform X3 [Salvia miltiorrhiza]XP_057786745.1 GTPase ERA-like, chloroplastic isoform X3 [Salvia miltiorrhiza]XP_057786746.1 GTPase ERA-like, chloroplastic isoform X3 [Salvia miltiorrhiza]XP_057786747.1 GTPase ERA-like, chloroplastic isoform X3 [Salvia miltiorrhiza]XP_057786748.1 GTPase ERA-like, chloroplastic isoform X3 [Salvia miltiorrhiza]XP_057786749.1 GTPase ERA-like, chloropla